MTPSLVNTTPSSVNAFTFPSDAESLNPVRPSQRDITPSAPELFARLQSTNPLIHYTSRISSSIKFVRSLRTYATAGMKTMMSWEL
jgi:hypothetical protein